MNIKYFFGVVLAFWGLVQSAFGCGYDDSDYQYYNFFHQGLISKSWMYEMTYAPDYPMNYYNTLLHEDEPVEQLSHTTDWLEIFDKSVDAETVDYVLYTLTESDLKVIELYIKGNKVVKVNDEIAQNGIVKLWLSGNYLETLKYLKFAKTCEYYANKTYGWYYGEENSEEQTDLLKKSALIEEAEEAYNKAINPLLRLRYAYQIIRMAHYTKQYKKATATYTQKVQNTPAKNYIYWLATEQYAGVLSAQNDNRAAYLFSRVYTEVPSRSTQCILSFKFSNRQNWDASYQMCKNDKERSIFYVMRAFLNGGLFLEEFENVYELDPQSPFLELLMARQINNLEREVFSTYESPDKFPLKSNYSQETLLKLVTACDKMIQVGNHPSLPFFILARGYAQLMLGNKKEAIANFRTISAPNYLKDHAILFEFLAELVTLETIDSGVEDYYWQRLKQESALNSCENLHAIMRDVFSKLVLKSGQKAKAFLCYNTPSNLESNLNLELIEDIILLHNKPNKSAFEKELTQNINANELIELKGTYYMQRNKLKEAAVLFGQLPEYYAYRFYTQTPQDYAYETFNTTIFAGNIKHHFEDKIEDQSDSYWKKLKYGAKVYTKLSLVQQLQQFEALAAVSKPEIAAEIYYALGNAWNNMSPYGFHRNVLFHHATNGHDYGYYANGIESYGIIDYKYYYTHPFYFYDAKIAFEYFEKALAQTQDKEFRARILAMAAKAELFQSYSPQTVTIDWSPYYNSNGESSMKYFRQLVEEYSTTNYYNELIEECYYFKAFLGL